MLMPVETSRNVNWGILDSPHSVVEFCIPVEVSMDGFFLILSFSGSEAVCSLLTFLNDDSGILSWLGVVGLKRTCDQKLSPGLLLTFRITLLFQFRIAATFFMIVQFQTYTFGSFFLGQPSNGVASPTSASRHFGLSHGYLDELAADGKTAPRAALTRSSTFRIKCGDDGFQHVHLLFHSIRVRVTYNEHLPKCLVSPTQETTSPASPRFSPSGFSVRCPTATVAMSSPSASRLSFSHWG